MTKITLYMELTGINVIREYLITDSADHKGSRSNFQLVRPIIRETAQAPPPDNDNNDDGMLIVYW